jgi:hypothetical protein
VEELDVIANEWHVNSLRQRGVLWDEMDDDDRIAVLAHYWRRHRVPLDMHTSEPATIGDMYRMARRENTAAKPRDPQEEMETRAAAVSALEAARARQRGQA